MGGKTCRWGILSTADIARKNWHSIVNSGNGQIVAVASRTIDKAQKFISECQASVPVPFSVAALGSYDELLRRADVDALYIPLPTGIRTEWVVRAAQAGKHVMVEKPCGVTAADVEEIRDACSASGVQFMDGVMFMHSARLGAMRKVLDDGMSVGTIRRIVSQFSFCADESWVQNNIRASSQLEPAGCLGDLGWYTIRMSLWAMNYELPVEVRGRILNGVKRIDSAEMVPMEFQGEMHFANGVSATFFNSFRTNQQQWAHISGTKGYLQIDDFVIPFFGNEVSFDVGNHQFAPQGCYFNLEKHLQSHQLPEYSNNARNAQETALFRHFGELVLSGKRDAFWPDVALKTQRILDAALQSARAGGVAVCP